jgi:hypothetical protein
MRLVRLSGGLVEGAVALLHAAPYSGDEASAGGVAR